jgi:hypothetical protein
VIELAIGPSHGVVTLQTSRGETRVRHGTDRGVVILLVATDAGCGSDVVVVIDVAIRTLARRHHVRTSQREAGLCVIESRRLPGCRIVASLAGLRESTGHVVRIGRALEVLEVARHASRAGEVVVVVGMAVRALARRHGMRPSQRESGGRVIELAIRPRHHVVTLLASGRETRVRNRSSGGIEVVLVATDASRACDIEVVINVAVCALPRRHQVRTGKRKTGGRVIELAAGPRDHVVTLLASCRKTGVRNRSSRGIEIVLVATDARRTRDVVVVVDMAISTLPRRHHVRTCQRESRLRVVKRRLLPG